MKKNTGREDLARYFKQNCVLKLQIISSCGADELSYENSNGSILTKYDFEGKHTVNRNQTAEQLNIMILSKNY